MNTLEVLYAAETSLRDESKPFQFMSGSTCTCGHLYAAFLNEVPGEVGTIKESSEDLAYGEIAMEVATVLGYDVPSKSIEGSLWYISDQTSNAFDERYEAVGPRDDIEREDALVVIRKAIDKIESREENARLQVVERSLVLV